MKVFDMQKEYEEIALKKIGEAMRYALKERGMSINRLERESGVNKVIIYKIFRGQGYEIKSLIRIMRVLQIHIEMSLLSAENNIWTMVMDGTKPSNN